jgi:CHAD domain-containing protein
VELSNRSRFYRLKRREPLAEGLKRVAAGRTEKALERLQGCGGGKLDPIAVHGARKDMKRLRTVLRILRDDLGDEVYKQEMRRYRDAARALSSTRDAEVKLATLDDLAEWTKELPENVVEAWRGVLARDRETATNAGDDVQAVIEQLETGLAQIEGWRPQGDSWETIDGALRRTYRRGRRAMQSAEADPSETNFHQWRKRAKDLWHELQLLSGAWSETLEPLAGEAHRLSDLLGDHHDLAVLRADLNDRRLGERETQALETVIEERQAGLATEAFELGRRLYAERPKTFGRRLHRYWEVWRAPAE